MKSSLLTALFLFVTFISLSAQEIYSKVKIDLTQTSIERVAALGLECDHGVYARGRHLINDFSEREIQLLADHQIPFTILVEDVVVWYQEQRLNPVGEPAQLHSAACGGTTTGPVYDYETPVNYQTGSMGGYLTYNQLLTTLDSMTAKFPQLITAKQPISTFTTHEGRPIHWLSISDNPALEEDEPEILYTALHHAREPNSLAQLIFYMWYLLENYETDPEVKYLVDNTRMYFIPCVNPDGYVFNENTNPNGGGMWRKNRWANNQGIKRGVDLNRNYGYLWGNDDQGSSPDQTSDVYRGPGPFSEPETQAIAFFLSDKNIKITLNCHTFSNLLIRPVTTEEPDNSIFNGFGEILTRANNYTFGNDLETVGYLVNGDSDSWMYNEAIAKPKIFALTPEIGPSFWPQPNQIDQLNKEVMEQNLIAAHLLYDYVEIIDNSPVTLNSLTGNIDLDLKNYGLENGENIISVTAGTPNLTVDFTDYTANLANLETATISPQYTIAETGATIETLKFVISVNSGDYTRVDTLYKNYINAIADTEVVSDGNNLSSFSPGANWGITDATFVSPDGSITDSPNGIYSPEDISEIKIAEPIDLTNAVAARLKFWAKWQIETDYDYVQVLASDNPVINFNPLCGLYTNTTSNTTDGTQPLYDGTQIDWVLEEIDLCDYLGGLVYLRFQLVSDQFVEEDGFYFDDLTVDIYNSNTTSTTELAASGVQFQAYPNPFGSTLNVQVNLEEQMNNNVIVLVNALGQTILTQNYTTLAAGRHDISFATKNLTAGIYFVQLKNAEGLQQTIRVVK